MALSASTRNALPNSEFAGPNRSFPVQSPKQTRAALRLERYASPATKAKIDAKARSYGILVGALKGKK